MAIFADVQHYLYKPKGAGGSEKVQKCSDVIEMVLNYQNTKLKSKKHEQLAEEENQFQLLYILRITS